MKILMPAPGLYILAVSGGVDSMVLFDALRRAPGIEFVVAHVDHGIRSDSGQDREFVESVATSYNIPVVTKQLALGPRASEAAARTVRYCFLRECRKTYGARAIIAAHHQDDVLETAIINLIRGTGRYGLTSLRSTSEIVRPLLEVPRAEIMRYAVEHKIVWHEDSTNQDQAYLRNYVRWQVMPQLDPQERQKFLEIIVRQKQVNDRIDGQLTAWLDDHKLESPPPHVALPRYQLIMLPDDVAAEILQAALKRCTGKRIERMLNRRALHFARTALQRKCFQLSARWQIRVARAGKIMIEPRGMIYNNENTLVARPDLQIE